MRLAAIHEARVVAMLAQHLRQSEKAGLRARQLDHRVGHAGQEPRRHRFNAAHRARAGGVGAVEHPAVLRQAVDVGCEIASTQAAHVLRAQAFLQDDHHVQRLVAPHGGLLFVQAGVARIQRRAGQARLFADDGVHAVHRHLRIHRR
ncbi:hypothetical protein D3C87_1371830 [compost metagenome]